ncbi:anti-sigma factor [Sinorhizobium sp. BG8]|uniref:anti-sigma factor family protein n=1 Tax=Sinorhizobium sp. BG8 TaxID=2613773 RepID=UPI00193D348B|nr:anti-sigma factor [Sinorhizobium sp. BG8]QRM57515.1 anti-sigma factor [Sinorhizobium sp. BG8]
MTSNDPILDADLHAYVDDQLDVGRRIEVEAFLSERPSVAAKVMADLRVRDELRLALADHRPVNRQATRDAARMLERSLSRRRLFDLLRRAAVIAAFVGAGWAGHALIGPFGATAVVASVPAPAFVDEAVRAHRTAMLRETMPHSREEAVYDPAEVRSATGIVLPELPKSWKVVDVQIFPSAFGPSVELAVEPSKGERMSLFAVRPGTFAVQQVLSRHADETQAAYWQIGEVAYALVSDQRKVEELSEAASGLFRTLY